MSENHLVTIASELNLKEKQVKAVADLLSDGATVPFIARYRKEASDSLDEVAITAIRDRIHQLEELDQRRDAILKSLEQHGHLTDELNTAVLAAETMAALEDIYLPYRPKRRTKATIAKEKGLEPLAEAIWVQNGQDPDILAADFIDAEKGVASIEEALSGARDIMAEKISEDQTARAKMRQLYLKKGVFQSKVATGMETTGVKYKDYFEWQEPAQSAPSHRILAMRRGEKEDILNLTVAPDPEAANVILEALFVKGEAKDAQQVAMAAADGYKRLLSRAMETELRLITKDRADAEAIKIFSTNLRQLLLAPPLGAKRVMGIDPGFRTGCKVVCLDAQGKLLHHDTIYPHTGKGKQAEAVEQIKTACARFEIEAIAIGNGTAGRETEAFIRDLGLDQIQVILVNESGASIYSASEVARNEFPDLDLTVRGSASIGRRLMDPLAELVKIDPKSIGVGQYQHDVDQTALKQGLDDVVASCVNSVGVDANRASAPLLTYVSGLGPQLATNIVTYRDENGPFTTRKALKKVPRLGPKAFEQAAGFLRIADGVNLLDKSAVHPESYHIVDAMAADLNCSVADLMTDPKLREQIDLSRYVSDTVGLPTLKDILAELAKPGRDPRQEFKAFAFEDSVNKIDDLETGMKLPGIVTNIVAFGAFVDIGVHQDGLVHISEMADKFIKDPATVVKVHQEVEVTVLEIDLKRQRIALSMKKEATRKTLQKKRPTARKPPPKTNKPAKQPFNNPFADAFKKLGG
jgi:protein Tex